MKLFGETLNLLLYWQTAKDYQSQKVSRLWVSFEALNERSVLKAGPPPPPLEAILVIFGRRALIFFLFVWKLLEKKRKMTPLLCACAVVITLETQKCWKRAPCSVEFNFFIICDRHKRFSQIERRRADLQKEKNVASDFLIFAWRLGYDLSKFSDDFTPFFDFERPQLSP